MTDYKGIGIRNLQGAGYFQGLARYNLWANARLYNACLDLPVEAYEQERGAFFGSIGRTLNHILVADRIWLARFRGVAPAVIQLDSVPFPDRAALWAARREEDEGTIALFDGFDDLLLSGDWHYHDTKGVPHSLPVPVAFGHFFNHQTHHRGQVHNMVTQAGAEAPPLDFSYFYLGTK